MKISKKRIITFMGALVISVSSITGALCVNAQSTTPVTGNGTVTIQQPEQSTQTPADTTQETQEVEEIAVPTPVAVVQQETGVVEQTQAQKATDKKYASKGFVILWFFLGVLVNVILSFMIANRFYKMSKRENHINSEIRALRRDLEEKFVNSVGGFSEMETDVTNTNDNYSADGSIDLAEPKQEEYSKESDDVFKQWENKMARRSARNIKQETNQENVADNEETAIDETVRFSTRKYSPTRENLVSEEIPEEETKADIIKNKAKGIINNIFPFKD